MGFVEFTPIPAANGGKTEDNILVALNQKTYVGLPTPPSGKSYPDLALTNYGLDWAVTSSTSTKPDKADATDDYTAVEPLYKVNCDEMWNVANPGAPSVTAKRCVRVNAKYTGKLVKQGSGTTPPTDIDIAYDKITVGAGWNLY